MQVGLRLCDVTAYIPETGAAPAEVLACQHDRRLLLGEDLHDVRVRVGVDGSHSRALFHAVVRVHRPAQTTVKDLTHGIVVLHDVQPRLVEDERTDLWHGFQQHPIWSLLEDETKEARRGGIGVEVDNKRATHATLIVLAIYKDVGVPEFLLILNALAKLHVHCRPSTRWPAACDRRASRRGASHSTPR